MSDEQKTGSDGHKPELHKLEDHESAPEQAPIAPGMAMAGIVAVLVIAALLAGYGIFTRLSADKVLADRTTELAAPTVLVAPAKPGSPVDTFVLPGNVSALTDSPIYARTSGYLTKWYFDIGAKVKKGALLAEIATPEVD